MTNEEILDALRSQFEWSECAFVHGYTDGMADALMFLEKFNYETALQKIREHKEKAERSIK